MKNEQIDLEYMVEFEDGLKPKLNVYAVDYGAGEIYEAAACLGLSVKVGNSVSLPNNQEKNVRAYVDTGTELIVSVAITKKRGKLKKTDGWEQMFCEKCREEGINVIKVKDPKHLQPAIRRHAELYQKQFEELEGMCLTVFEGFMAMHPGYFKYR